MIQMLRSCFFVIKRMSSLKISFIAMVRLIICRMWRGLKFALNIGIFIKNRIYFLPTVWIPPNHDFPPPA